MSLGGGSPSGSTTTTTTNPAAQAQLPYLQGLYQSANHYFNTLPFNVYGGQTLANPNPGLVTAYQHMENFGNNGSPPSIAPSISSTRAIAGRGAGALTQEGNRAQQISAFAAERPVDPETAALRKTESGAYLNANPYLNKMFGAASDAVTRGYQTATAPQTDSAFEASGRYGSGALANARSQNQLDLGTTLNNLAANIYGGNYANERQLMTQASGTAGQLSLAQLLGRGGLENMAAQRYGDQVDAALKSNAIAPSLLGAQIQALQTGAAGGGGLTSLNQAQIQDAISRYYTAQSAPWQNLAQYSAYIGNPVLGSNSITQPYFANPAASTLAGITGGLGIANNLFGGNGLLSGLFSGDSTYSSDASPFGIGGSLIG